MELCEEVVGEVCFDEVDQGQGSREVTNVVVCQVEHLQVLVLLQEVDVGELSVGQIA